LQKTQRESRVRTGGGNLVIIRTEERKYMMSCLYAVYKIQGATNGEINSWNIIQNDEKTCGGVEIITEKVKGHNT
jgi:hypothetical protein